MDFTFNYDLLELQKRTSPECLKNFELLSADSDEYKNLTKNQKAIVEHLVKAGEYIDKAYYKMENKHNLEFQKFLDDEISKGNEIARLTSILYYAQKSMFSPDQNGNFIQLVKNIKKPIACNFYPENLTKEKFHNIINNMLDSGKIDEVKLILSQYSMVTWNGNELIGIPYVEYFNDEFSACAKELIQASKLCEDEKFTKFLTIQAEALTKFDLELDRKADYLWATTSYPIEFTIIRESYDDAMTSSIMENKNLSQKIQELSIPICSKDTLGARVGIINGQGTQFLKNTQNIINVIADNMPLQDKYTHNYTQDDNKQASIDVDLICLTGDAGAYQAGVTLAENLPNNDKLEVVLDGYRKNEYHRQIRSTKKQDYWHKILCQKQWQYFDNEAEHWGVICHENTHTLGPCNVNLSQYTNIIEECKADLGAVAFLPELQVANIFSTEEIKSITCSFLLPNFIKSKPTSLQQAHAVERILILNYMIKDRAIFLNEEKKVEFNFNLCYQSAKQMLNEIISIQLSNDSNFAKSFLDKYYKWLPEIEYIAKIIRENNKILNGKLSQPILELYKEEK